MYLHFNLTVQVVSQLLSFYCFKNQTLSFHYVNVLARELSFHLGT